MQVFGSSVVLLMGAPLGALIFAGMRAPRRLVAGLLVTGCAISAGLTFGWIAPAQLRWALPFEGEIANQAGGDAPVNDRFVTNLATSGRTASVTLEDDGSALLPGLDQWTAVYDISAHTVYLPNGTTLEAHSGLGARMDDPRFVHEHMRGPTPPSVYELEMREKPFHGVRALRLKPLDDRATYGRKGLLAHTYMLGPRGDSNGCVVFRDYGLFLQAFDSGELKRLVVVSRLDGALFQRAADRQAPAPRQGRSSASVAVSGVLSH